MYVCICNGIKEKDVRAAVNSGADTVSRVFKSQGCKPECGNCIGCMRDIMEDEMRMDDLPMAAE